MTKFSEYLAKHHITTKQCSIATGLAPITIITFRRKGIVTTGQAKRIAEKLFEPDYRKILEYPESMRVWLDGEKNYD